MIDLLEMIDFCEKIDPAIFLREEPKILFKNITDLIVEVHAQPSGHLSADRLKEMIELNKEYLFTKMCYMILSNRNSVDLKRRVREMVNTLEEITGVYI